MDLETPSGEVTTPWSPDIDWGSLSLFHSWNTDGRYGWYVKFHKAKIKSTFELTWLLVPPIVNVNTIWLSPDQMMPQLTILGDNWMVLSFKNVAQERLILASKYLGLKEHTSPCPDRLAAILLTFQRRYRNNFTGSKARSSCPCSQNVELQWSGVYGTVSK